MTESKTISIRDLLLPVMPPILYRNHPRFKEWTGMAPRTMANMDSKGTGPRERLRMGRTVGYPKEALIEWLEAKIVIVSTMQKTGKENAEKNINSY